MFKVTNKTEYYKAESFNVVPEEIKIALIDAVQVSSLIVHRVPARIFCFGGHACITI